MHQPCWFQSFETYVPRNQCLPQPRGVGCLSFSQGKETIESWLIPFADDDDDDDDDIAQTAPKKMYVYIYISIFIHFFFFFKVLMDVLADSVSAKFEGYIISMVSQPFNFQGWFLWFQAAYYHRHLVVFDTAVAILADACFHLLHLHHCWCSHTIHGCTICSWHGAGCVGAHGTLVKTETNKIHSSFQESKTMWRCFMMEICWKYDGFEIGDASELCPCISLFFGHAKYQETHKRRCLHGHLGEFITNLGWHWLCWWIRNLHLIHQNICQDDSATVFRHHTQQLKSKQRQSWSWVLFC